MSKTEYAGMVTSYLADKGYGFIKGDDGNDYYFKRNQVVGGIAPAKDARVTFDPEATPRGFAAKAVSVSGVAQDIWENPDHFVVSEHGHVSGLEVLYAYKSPCWTTATIHAQARQQLIDQALTFGANGIFGLRIAAVPPKGTIHLEGTMVYVQHASKSWDGDEVLAAQARVQEALEFASRADVGIKESIDISPIVLGAKALRAAGRLVGLVRSWTGK
jgi:cold shock CspA family protein